MTTFPAAIDTALGLTLADDITPDAQNELDARTRALEAKVGIDNDPLPTTHDWQLRVLLDLADTWKYEEQTVGAVAVVPWVQAVPALGGLTVLVQCQATKDDGTLAAGWVSEATFRAAGGVATMVGAQTDSHAVADGGFAPTLVLSAVGANAIATITGVGGHTINWKLRVTTTPLT